MTISKANFRLVKNSNCPKYDLQYLDLYLKMSKTRRLLVLVSLKYCAEKRLLKTHVAFFMKVTVYRAKTQVSIVCEHRGIKAKVIQPTCSYIELLSTSS
jgi:hypothetical protein